MASAATLAASRRGLARSLIAGAAALCLFGTTQAQETFKLGIVSFLSGQAAESFGIPAVNGAKVVIEAFNSGKAPAPYNKVGFGGVKIEPIYVDENGGATKQVQELRNLYDREKVDAVVGYVGSGDCLAVAPVAEEMKKFLILYDCGTPRIFEDGKYTYVFRTASHAAMDNVALVRYLKSHNVKIDNFNMINQDYAWGQDSKKDFTWTMEKLYPSAKPGEDQLPKFGAGQYGTEISALMAKPADVTHSSLWGGDLQAFILQAGPRGLFKRTQVVFSAADHVLPGLGDKMPDGVILGARGAYGQMSPKSALNDWWWDIYEQGLQRLPGAGAIPHGAVAARFETRGREGDGGQRRQEAVARTAGCRAQGPRMGFARGPHPHGTRRRTPGDPGNRDRQDALRRGQEDGGARRHPALQRRMRQPAGRHEIGRVDQGRLPRRQVPVTPQ